jgi:hypothetical protein
VRSTWFDIAESAFGLMLLMEFVIKVVADGFMFTLNAYVRSFWNVLDFVMASLLVDVAMGLILSAVSVVSFVHSRRCALSS